MQSLKIKKSLPVLGFPEAKVYVGEWRETAVYVKQ